MTTSHILMVRPAAFAYNAQTAVNNTFQQKSIKDNVQEKALQEFDDFVTKLRNNGINVLVIQDNDEPHTPDSIFPNNWISLHEDGTVVLYPMFAENRRLERTKNIIEKLSTDFFIRSTINLTHYEKQNIYLEGTGSMILDRDNEFAYACLSPRTDASALYEFCDAMGFRPVIFNAVDANEVEIYHTNVMMCLTEDYVVICLEAIKDDFQKQMLIDKFKETDKELIEISMEQMNRFAGNMLQVENDDGELFLVMSSNAYEILTNEQLSALQAFNEIIHSPLTTIEINGGGSARCMMAEIFLQPIEKD